MATEKNVHVIHDEIVFVTGEIGQERLDANIHHANNDPHTVALEDFDIGM